MKLSFEGDIPAPAGATAVGGRTTAAGDNTATVAKKPNQASAFLATVHWLFAHLLTPFCPLIFCRSSFRK